jgi:hypothetical protein
MSQSSPSIEDQTCNKAIQQCWHLIDQGTTLGSPKKLSLGLNQRLSQESDLSPTVPLAVVGGAGETPPCSYFAAANQTCAVPGMLIMV